MYAALKGMNDLKLFVDVSKKSNGFLKNYPIVAIFPVSMTTFKDSVLFPVEAKSILNLREKRVGENLQSRVRRTKSQAKTQKLAKSFDDCKQIAEENLLEVKNILAKTKAVQYRNNILVRQLLSRENDSGKHYAWNPRRRPNVLDPEDSIRVYTRERNFLRLEDQLFGRHVRCIEGIYRNSRLEIPKITRDENNLRILDELEIYKLNSEWPQRYEEEYDDDVLLFNYNWPLVEPNIGKSFQEFIKR